MNTIRPKKPKIKFKDIMQREYYACTKKRLYQYMFWKKAKQLDLAITTSLFKFVADIKLFMVTNNPWYASYLYYSIYINQKLIQVFMNSTTKLNSICLQFV